MRRPKRCWQSLWRQKPHLRQRLRRTTRRADELVGPCESPVEEEPPATSPKAVPDAPLPVRMKRSRRSPGCLLERMLDFEHHVILVQLREDGGYFALAVRVVERLVDGGRRNSQARRGVAVELQRGAKALRLLIAGDVGQFRQLPKPRQHFGRVRVQFVGARVFQRVLELGAAHAVLHREVLHRLHEQRDTGHFCELRLKTANHLGRTDFSLIERLQIDQDAAAVERGIGSIDSDERREIVDRRIGRESTWRCAAAASTFPGTTRSARPPKHPGSRPYPEWGKSLWGSCRTGTR